MFKIFACVFSLVGILCLHAPVCAQVDTRPKDKRSPANYLPSGERTLELREALTLALENNLKIQIARKKVQIAEIDQKQAREGHEREIAKQNTLLADANFELISRDVIRDVEIAYWDLANGKRDLAVKQTNLKTTIILLEENRALSAAGRLDPLDVMIPGVQVSKLESAFYDTREIIIQAENTLKSLMIASRSDQLWSESFKPDDTVELTQTTNFDLSSMLEAAIANRPELDVNNIMIEINALNKKYYEHKGTAQDIRKNAMERENLQAERGQVEMQIDLDVRDAVMKLQNAEKRLGAMISSRQNLEKLHAEETNKLATGESNTKIFLESQGNLLEARLSELRAQSEYRKGVARLRWATGMTF